MKQSAFAALCGISQPMVSKYAGQGLLVTTAGGEIDPHPSLVALEGRLDEPKRQQALKFLGTAHTPPAAGAGARPKGAKAEKDEIDRDLKALQLAREMGEVVLVEDVEATAVAAVSAMREAFGNGRRDLASSIAATFAIPSEKQPALVRLLSQGFEAALGAFSREMGAAAQAARAPRASEPPARGEGAPLQLI